MPAHSHYQTLKEKWTARRHAVKQRVITKHQNVLQWLWDSFPHKQHIAATSLSALLLLIPPLPQLHSPLNAQHANLTSQTQSTSSKSHLVTDLSSIVPSEIRPLSPEEETQITYVLSRDLNMPVKSELQGIRLNRSYGKIGGEQHLARYPGDTLAKHAIDPNDHKMFLRSGMAPGLGSFRYFAESAQTMTQKDIDRERYYIAAPYHLSEGYNDHVTEYKDFFKFRKMIVVNPKTGAAVVTVIGDAGPGQSTGKHLGGSPEVMHYLDLGTGARKGAVLYFFVDDPSDTIPLGPVN